MNCLIVTNMLYGSIRSLSPASCNQSSKTLDNIIKASGDFHMCFIINDCHVKNDPEFLYIPEHNIVGTSDTSRLLSREEGIRSGQKVFLTKNQLSAIHSEHNKKLILSYGFNDICIAGFSATLDTIPTCLDFMQLGRKVYVDPTMIGDVSVDRKDKALEYLGFMGLLKEKNGTKN